MNLNLSHRRKKRGFSLVEVVLSIGILCFCIIPVFGMLLIAFNTTRSSVDLNVETRMLQTARSYFLARPFSALTNTSLFFDADGQEVPAGDPPRYRLEAQISEEVSLPGGSLRSLKRLSLSILNLETKEISTNHFHVPDNGF
jgi:uncharacterized protein (TIGR02598 family)